ncbi:MAG: hypothetical protein OXJ62_13320 [Spirochaetaceae bacterium]|nr:hypothetical protein [Spirochaetaceae bacterium]
MATKRNGTAPVAPVASVVAAASVVAVTPRLVNRRLHVEAVVRGAGGLRTAARVPDRELAALLPRSILAAGGDPAPQLLETIAAILKRTVVGRRVKVWEYGDQRYLAFLSWSSVRFRVGQANGAGRGARPGSRTRRAS